MKKSGIKSVLISILAMVLAAMSLLFVACGETEEPPPPCDRYAESARVGRRGGHGDDRRRQ